jgi:hypothetical protein
LLYNTILILFSYSRQYVEIIDKKAHQRHQEKVLMKHTHVGQIQYLIELDCKAIAIPAQSSSGPLVLAVVHPVDLLDDENAIGQQMYKKFLSSLKIIDAGAIQDVVGRVKASDRSAWTIVQRSGSVVKFGDVLLEDTIE